MSFYFKFEPTRKTELYLPSLIQSLRTRDRTIGISVSNNVYIAKKETEWAQEDVQFVENIINNSPELSDTVIAKFAVDKIGLLDKAILLVLIDQINIIRVRLGFPELSAEQVFQDIREKIDNA
jgi:hypothetical protein